MGWWGATIRGGGRIGTQGQRGDVAAGLEMPGGHQGLGPCPPRASAVSPHTVVPWGHPAGPTGGQKVSFAGGIDEREEDLKSLTVSEIPEDPEGAEGDEEEPGQEQDGGTGGTWGATPPSPRSPCCPQCHHTRC